ncbi:MAG: hypothetical protein WC058_06825 [Phycisphaeraceae bacterium]
MPPTTVIFTAVAPEAIPIIRRLRLSTRSPSQYTSEHTLLQITGMGQSRARQSAQQLLTNLRPQRVLITGLCGALDPSLKVADVLHVTKIITRSPNPQTFTPTPIGLASTPLFNVQCAMSNVQCNPRTPHIAHRTSHIAHSPIELASMPSLTSGAILFTADHLIATPVEKSRLRQQTAAHAVDMESAAVAAVCDALHIPWLCLRAVSDTADQSLPAYLADMVDPLGRPRPLAALRQLLPHPSRLRTLTQIARRSRAAVDALAEKVRLRVAGFEFREMPGDPLSKPETRNPKLP